MRISLLAPKIHRTREMDDSGVTLAEMVATVTIFVIVGSMMVVQFDSWSKNSQITQDRSEAMSEGRLAMAYLSRNLRQAGITDSSTPAFTEAGPFSLTYLDITSTAAQSGRYVRVTYQIQNGVLFESRTLSTGQSILSNRPIASFIANQTESPAKEPVFRYYSGPRTETTPTELPSSVVGNPLTPQELDRIVAIGITLIMDKSPNDELARTTFTEFIYVRSRGFQANE